MTKGAEGSRHERRLMRQRGAGFRKLENATFGFSFPAFSLPTFGLGSGSGSGSGSKSGNESEGEGKSAVDGGIGTRSGSATPGLTTDHGSSQIQAQAEPELKLKPQKQKVVTATERAATKTVASKIVEKKSTVVEPNTKSRGRKRKIAEMKNSRPEETQDEHVQVELRRVPHAEINKPTKRGKPGPSNSEPSEDSKVGIEDSNNVRQEAPPPSKRRGRPPKRGKAEDIAVYVEHEDVDAKPTRLDADENNVSLHEELKEETENEIVTLRETVDNPRIPPSRRRAKKGFKLTVKNEDGASDEELQDEVAVDSPPAIRQTKMRRTKQHDLTTPTKGLTEAKESILQHLNPKLPAQTRPAPAKSAPAPKKRGRPRKVSAVAPPDDPVSMQLLVEVQDAAEAQVDTVLDPIPAPSPSGNSFVKDNRIREDASRGNRHKTELPPRQPKATDIAPSQAHSPLPPRNEIVGTQQPPPTPPPVHDPPASSPETAAISPTAQTPPPPTFKSKRERPPKRDFSNTKLFFPSRPQSHSNTHMHSPSQHRFATEKALHRASPSRKALLRNANWDWEKEDWFEPSVPQKLLLASSATACPGADAAARRTAAASVGRRRWNL